MKCSRCEAEATKGKVESGEFVCDSCLKKDKIEAGQLITFYAMSSGFRSPEMKVVKATYKNGKTYFTRVDFEPGWPYDARVHKRAWGRREPGYRTAQEAVDERIKSLRYEMESKRKEAEKAEEKLVRAEAWVLENGYDLPGAKEPEPAEALV